MKLTKGRLKEIIVEELQRNKDDHDQLEEADVTAGIDQAFKTAMNVRAVATGFGIFRAYFAKVESGQVKNRHIAYLLLNAGITADEIAKNYSTIAGLMAPGVDPSAGGPQTKTTKPPPTSG